MLQLNATTKIISALAIAITVVLLVYLFDATKKVESEIYTNFTNKILNDLTHEEDLLENLGITNAIFLADRPAIKEALIKNDRSIAIADLKEVIKLFQKSTRIDNIKIHIHTNEVKAFIRSWKLKKFGDDLSGFRKAIVKVQKDHTPFFGFEVGRVGLTLRSIVPIKDGKNYLGSVEFIQDFSRVPKNFERKGNNHLLLIKDSYLKIATYLKGAPTVGNYKLSTNSFNEAFLQAAQAIDLDKLQKEKYLLTDKYFFTYKTIKDVEGNDLGMHLLASPAESLNTAVSNAKQSFLTIALITFISLIVILSALIFLRNK